MSKSIFLLFIGLIALSTPSTQTEARNTLDRLEASVNSSLILQSDVKKFRTLARLRSQLDPLFSGTSIATHGDQASSSEIVDFLISERLIAQHYPKTDSEVEQEINSIQNNNRLDRNKLQDALAAEGYQFSEYFELIRASGSKRDLIDRDIRTKVSISDEDLKNDFYNRYARNPLTARSYHLSAIIVSIQNYKTAGAAMAVAADALKDVRAGEPFEEVAKRVSDDESSGLGGDLGTLPEDQMLPAIRDRAKKMKIGEISPVFSDSTGSRLYILKLQDLQSNDADRFQKEKENIRNRLSTLEYQHQISLWEERHRQSAFIHRAGEASLKEIPLVQ